MGAIIEPIMGRFKGSLKDPNDSFKSMHHALLIFFKFIVQMMLDGVEQGPS